MGTALPAIMRMEGMSLQSITYLSLVALPTTIKFLWAPLIDRFGKKYFTWITFSTILYVLFFMPAAFLGPHNIVVLAILFTLAMVCMSTQDIAMDAFAIQSLSGKQRAIGNGIQTGGNYLGLLLGGGVLLLFYQRLGWFSSVMILSALTILPILTTTIYADRSYKTEIVSKASIKDHLNLFTDKEFRRWIPILVLLVIPGNIVYSFSSLMLIDKGFSLDQVGYMIGLCGGTATVCAGFLSGYLLRNISGIGKLLTAVTSSILCVICAVWLESLNANHSLTALVLCVSMGLMVGIVAMVINDISMSYVRPGREGTDYSIQLFLRYLLYTPMIILCGRISESFSYKTVFFLMLGIAMLITIILLYQLKVKKTRKNNLAPF